jgi:hypothetical protein
MQHRELNMQVYILSIKYKSNLQIFQLKNVTSHSGQKHDIYIYIYIYIWPRV